MRQHSRLNVGAALLQPLVRGMTEGTVAPTPGHRHCVSTLLCSFVFTTAETSHCPLSAGACYRIVTGTLQHIHCPSCSVIDEQENSTTTTTTQVVLQHEQCHSTALLLASWCQFTKCNIAAALQQMLCLCNIAVDAVPNDAATAAEALKLNCCNRDTGTTTLSRRHNSNKNAMA